MKAPLEWLKEYVTIRLSTEMLAHRLTLAGLEVVGIEEVEGQPVFDFEITPNRPDCLSIIGIAREIALITGQPLKAPKSRASKVRNSEFGIRNRKTKLPTPNSQLRIKIVIEDKKGCTRYIGTLIKGVKVGVSPEWMQKRLIACGMRPINNLVDITNYVLMEYGQPLHVFDYHKLSEGTIHVRRSKAKEVIRTLDEEARELASGILLIADSKRPIAIAGIKGGIGSEVTKDTTDILLESANFDPITIRRTARSLGLSSDASYRFERSVDPVGVEKASMRASDLICAIAGGEEVRVIDAGSKPSRPKAVLLDVNRMNRWLGTDITSADVRITLAKLGCRVLSSSEPGLLRVQPPSFRKDLSQEVDFYEELARSIGYDKLPSTLPQVPLAAKDQIGRSSYWRNQSLRCLCASLGLNEAVNWSLLSASDLSRCGFAPEQSVRLANPLSQDHSYLRPSLLMGLLQALRRNLTQGAMGVHLFECGDVVSSNIQAVEEQRLGIILSGLWSRDWQSKHLVDFFRLKGLLESLVGRLCGTVIKMQTAEILWADSKEAASVFVNDNQLGTAGQVSQKILHELDIENDVWFAEVSVSVLEDARRKKISVEAPGLFPPVKRDLSILVDRSTSFDSLNSLIRETSGALMGRLELIDRYSGSSIPAQKQSLTFSIEYRDSARTLTAEEADVIHSNVIQALAQQFGATLR